MGNVSPINENLFWCYNDNIGYEYLVEMDYPWSMSKGEQQLATEKAMKIAEKELDYYGSPDGSPDPGYYFSAGYVEVVDLALDELPYEHKIYVKCERGDANE